MIMFQAGYQVCLTLHRFQKVWDTHIYIYIHIYNEVCVSQYLKIGHSSVQRWKIASVSVCVSIHSHGPGLAPGSGCGLG